VVASVKTVRVGMVHLIIGLITAGSLFDIVTDSEHWPFSQYPMYASIPQDNREHTLSLARLFGVLKGDVSREIPLVKYEYIYPFDQNRLQGALVTRGGPEDRDQVLTTALRDCLIRYEALRQAGRHDGPALQGVRLYRLFWRLDQAPWNVDEPDRRQLILEVIPLELP
jgi:hypothetical protein